MILNIRLDETYDGCSVVSDHISVHTLFLDENYGETEVLFFVWGALEYLDEHGKTLYIEDWRSMLQRYIDFSEKNNLPVEDLTYPKDKVEDVHFHSHEL